MENLYNQPGIYAFDHPQNLPPMMVVFEKKVPRGLVWDARLGTYDPKKIQQTEAYQKLKKELSK